MKQKVDFQIAFKVMVMPCCFHQLNWLGSRLPNFCPECGKQLIPLLLPALEDSIELSDNNAELTFTTGILVS